MRQRVHYHLVGTEEHAELDYDHLVIALGSVTRLPNVPGLAEHESHHSYCKQAHYTSSNTPQTFIEPS